MKINTESLAKLAILGLLASVAAGIAISIFLPNFPISGFVASVSTFIIAIMTIEYVVTTKHQFSVMEKQLSEMRLDRELNAQPVPVITEPSFSIEQPRLFHSPDENYVGAHSRYFFKFGIENRGMPPAVGVIATGHLLVPGDAKPLVLKSASENINVLESGTRHPIDKDSFLDFMYPSDHDHKLLNVLRDGKSKEKQVLVVRIIYKNALGACFVATSYFYVYIKKTEDYELLGKWHSRLASFPVEQRDKIEKVKELKSKSNDSWHEAFSELKGVFSESLAGEEELTIACIEIPNSFELKVITEQEYKKISEKTWFGTPVPEWVSGCLVESE